MKESILGLRDEMEQAIEYVSHSANRMSAIEQGYQIADAYWQRVKHLIRGSGFPDNAAEIEFFKHIKPKFTAHLEYCLLLYRYQGYVESEGEALTAFRAEETERIRKFRQTHAIFIDYYLNGRTEWDDVYFLRRKFNKVQRPPSQVYDRAQDFWTNGDWIVTLYLANARFEDMLQSGNGCPW
ncbi:MAG TPA: RteC domain-containing protein [Puia sp.]|nr:RteC domain-containing protein [Puia sp.]